MTSLSPGLLWCIVGCLSVWMFWWTGRTLKMADSLISVLVGALGDDWDAAIDYFTMRSRCMFLMFLVVYLLVLVGYVFALAGSCLCCTQTLVCCLNAIFFAMFATINKIIENQHRIHTPCWQCWHFYCCPILLGKPTQKILS